MKIQFLCLLPPFTYVLSVEDPILGVGIEMHIDVRSLGFDDITDLLATDRHHELMVEHVRHCYRPEPAISLLDWLKRHLG